MGTSKADRTELALQRISALKDVADDAIVIEEVRQFLADRSNLVVAKAAKVVRQRSFTQLIHELVTAFQRFMAEPSRLDKRCAAVTEIAAALYDMDYVEPELYLQGIHHVQMEASFGPPVDAAAELRGICARGLVRTRHPHALDEVVSLLVDSWAVARLGAVQALSLNGGDAGALVLRLKALVGDRDVEVMAECFSGLLASGNDSAVDFVAASADREGEENSEAAILALGACRLPKAIELLKEKCHREVRTPARKTILLALATSRDEGALRFLLAELKEASVQRASEILAALAVEKSSERIRRAVSEAVDDRRDPDLLAAFRRYFSER